MKEKPLLIIAVVVILFLALGASAFALHSYNQTKATKAQQALEMLKPAQEAMENKQNAMEQKQAMSGTMLDLFKKGGNLTCTFKGMQADQQYNGVIYVSGQKVRGEFEILVAAKPVKSNVITDGEYIYSWSDLTPQGLKMKLSDAEATDSKVESVTEKLSPEVLQNMEQFQQEVDYDCKSWSPNASYFEVPANVKFIDFSAMDPAKMMEGLTGTAQDAMDKAAEELNNEQDGTQGSTGATGDDNAKICSTCNLIPDPEAKAACLQNYGCN